MEIVNQIGHVQFWGMSPAANVLLHHQPAEGRPVRVLMSGCSDPRHILKTLADSLLAAQHSPLTAQDKQHPPIEVYFHETNKELLARCLLLLHVVHETALNFDERIELFLDLFGNAMIKERNARYLHNLREDLLNLIHAEKSIATPLQRIVSLKLLKFEERDELSEIVQSWSMKVPFEMEKLRDQKLRALYRERYDFRANLVDWDFNMLLMPCAPIVHYYHYREWRLTGLAFEQRFSKYSQPNRTLSSYAAGRRKEERTSCLVRGYWGDIVVSPYVALGVRCDYPQHDLLFKKANLKFIGHSVEVAEYNMNYWLHALEKGQQYVRHFRDYYRADEDTRKKLEERNEQKKKRKGQLKDIKEEDIEEKEEEEGEKAKPPEKPGRELDSDEEEQKKKVETINSKEIAVEKQSEVLPGFAKFNLSVHLMAMNSEKLITKKYEGFFDVVVLGFVHTAYLTKGVHSLVAQGGLLLTEKATYLIPKKKEERAELNDKLKGLIEQEKSFSGVAEDTDYFIYRRK